MRCAAAAIAALICATCAPTEEVAVIRMQGGGEIRIRLLPDQAPKTVAHFSKLVREGFYDGTTFHLVIPGFMIQGGDPNSLNDIPGDDGFGGPGYTVEDEASTASHIRGTVSLSRTSRPNSGGSQFFIMVSDTDPDGRPWRETLDGKYTVFGRVISGLDVVDTIASAPTAQTSEIPGQESRPLEDQRMATVFLEPAPS